MSISDILLLAAVVAGIAGEFFLRRELKAHDAARRDLLEDLRILQLEVALLRARVTKKGLRLPVKVSHAILPVSKITPRDHDAAH